MFAITKTVLLWSGVALVMFVLLPDDFKMPAAFLCFIAMLIHRGIELGRYKK